MAGRWAKLYEKTEDWQWYKDGNTARVFFHLLIKTNYKDTTWKGLVVKRGQLVTSLPSLAKALGISVQNVRTALDHLVSTGEISQEITNSYRLVTVNNWGIYQGEEGEKTDEVTGDQQANQQANHKQINRQKRQHKAVKMGNVTNKSTGKSTDELTADIEDIYRISLSHKLTDEAFAWLGSTMPPLMQSDIEDLMKAGQADEGLVLEAIKIAKGKGKRSWPYAHGVLKGMIGDGYTTGQAYKEARRPRAGPENKDERGINAGGKYREKVDWEQHFDVIED